MYRGVRANNKHRYWVGMAAAVVMATAANGQGTGSGSPPNMGFYHGGWCGHKKDDLQSQYQAALRSYYDAKAYYDAAVKARAAALARGDSQAAESDAQAMEDAQTEMDRIRAIIADLRRDWNNIKGQCGFTGDIGDDPDASSPSSTNSSNGGAGGGDGGGGGGTGTGGGGASGGGIGRNNTSDLLLYEMRVAPPNDSAHRTGIKGLGVLLGRHFAARRALRLALDSLDKPAITHDSLGTARARMPTPGVPEENISPVANKGLEAVAYLDRETADLIDYRVDYGRYLGAMKARDTSSAREQAGTMQRLIDDAVNSAYDAAARLADVDEALHASLSPASARSSKVAPPRFTASVNPELARELAKAGLSASDSTERMNELRTMSAAELAKGFRQVTARLAADSLVRHHLADARASGKWPRPSELAELDAARATAMSAEMRLEPNTNGAAATQAGSAGPASGPFSSHRNWPLMAVAGAAALVVLAGAGVHWLRTPRQHS